MVKLPINEICYVESLQDYLKIHLKDEVLVVRETLSNMNQYLGHQKFVRCHRSYIIGIRHITAYTNEYLSMGDKVIPISRSYKEEVLSRLQGYCL